MKKRTVVVVVLAVVSAAAAYAQTTDFFKLLKTGTPQQIQAAINKGADAKAQDKDGMTALMYAAAQNQSPGVQLEDDNCDQEPATFVQFTPVGNGTVCTASSP